MKLHSSHHFCTISTESSTWSCS